MQRIGIFGWGVVAPKSPNVEVFEKNLEENIEWLEPFEGFGPNNFMVGQPDFDFRHYRNWIDARFEPRKFSQLNEKMGNPVKYAIGAFIQALGQNEGLEGLLRELGIKSHVYVSTGLGDFPTQYEVSRQYARAQIRWNKFWCQDAHHKELKIYRAASSKNKRDICANLGTPPDPGNLSIDDVDFADAQESWYEFWVRRSDGLHEYLEVLKTIEGENIGGNIDTDKSHQIRHKIASRRKLNNSYGCPTEPWSAVDPRLLWNIHNISAAQISMLGQITGPAWAPAAACSGFGTALKQGINAIRLGQAKVAVVGATDPNPHPLSVGTFYGARVLSNDGVVSKPFTGLRGSHVAGGACIWIVGDADFMMGKGLKPLGLEILSVALTSDADHIITPSTKGSLAAIEEAIQDAGITPDDVATWDLHATATPGDWTELKNVLTILPQTTRFTTRKGSFGHGMSVCGGWELTAQHLGVAKAKLMPVDLPEDEIHAQIRPYRKCLVGDKPVDLQGEIAGKINMGVGGINACVISRKWPDI